MADEALAGRTAESVGEACDLTDPTALKGARAPAREGGERGGVAQASLARRTDIYISDHPPFFYSLAQKTDIL
jgi:hypothetical protein